MALEWRDDNVGGGADSLLEALEYVLEAVSLLNPILVPSNAALGCPLRPLYLPP